MPRTWQAAVKTDLNTLSVSPSTFLPATKEETSASSSKGLWGRDPEQHKHISMWFFFLMVRAASLSCMVGFSIGFYLLILALISLSSLNFYVFCSFFIEHCKYSYTKTHRLQCLIHSSSCRLIAAAVSGRSCLHHWFPTGSSEAFLQFKGCHKALKNM